MTVRGFAYRFAYIVLFVWINGSMIGSFWWGLYFTGVSLYFVELFRSHFPRDDGEPEPDEDI